MKLCLWQKKDAYKFLEIDNTTQLQTEIILMHFCSQRKKKTILLWNQWKLSTIFGFCFIFELLKWFIITVTTVTNNNNQNYNCVHDKMKWLKHRNSVRFVNFVKTISYTWISIKSSQFFFKLKKELELWI